MQVKTAGLSDYILRKSVDRYIARLNLENSSKNPAILYNRSNGALSHKTKRLLHRPGTVSALYRYLHTDGQNKVPELVGGYLGDHWYTGLAKKLSSTSMGRNFVVDNIMDKTLPTINGDNSLARRFLEAGGQV